MLQILAISGFEISLVRSSETSKNDSRTSGIPTGGCLNKKDGLTRYGDSHVKDKTS